MAYLIILLSALASCAKVTVQGYLSRGNIKNSTDSVLANCVIFAFTFLLFSVGLRNGINLPVIGYSAAFGILSVSFQVFYALALKSGPFSATCMLVNLSMVLPVIFSSIYYKEAVTVTKSIGIILCALALFLNVKGDGKKINLKWILYILLAFVSTGSISIAQKLFARSEIGGNTEQFIFFGYLIAFVLSCIIFFAREKTTHERTFKLNKKTILLAFFVAAFLGVFQFCYTYGNSFIDAIILVPSVSGLATMFQTLAGRVIFKEKFTAKQIGSICVGIAAIVLLSL